MRPDVSQSITFCFAGLLLREIVGSLVRGIDVASGEENGREDSQDKKAVSLGLRSVADTALEGLC